VVQLDLGLAILLQPCGILYLIAPKRSCDLLGEGLLFTEFCEQGLMQEILDVFGVIKGGRMRSRFIGLLEVAWFSRVDSLEDAETAEVWESDLKLADCLRSSDVVFGLSSLALLLDFAHLSGSRARCREVYKFKSRRCATSPPGFEKKFRDADRRQHAKRKKNPPSAQPASRLQKAGTVFGSNCPSSNKCQ